MFPRVTYVLLLWQVHPTQRKISFSVEERAGIHANPEVNDAQDIRNFSLFLSLISRRLWRRWIFQAFAYAHACAAQRSFGEPIVNERPAGQLAAVHSGELYRYGHLGAERSRQHYADWFIFCAGGLSLTEYDYRNGNIGRPDGQRRRRGGVSQ